MATTEQLMAALKKADAAAQAGDKGAAEDARKIAQLIAQQRSAVGKPAQQPTPEGYDFSWGEMASNIPESGAKWAKETGTGLYQTVTSPWETAKTLGKVAAGGMQRLIPGKQDWEQQYFDPVANFYSDRYGSWDQFKQTAEQDPVGTLADIALAPTLAGGALKAGSVVPRVIGKAGLGPVTDLAGRGGQLMSAAGSGLLHTGAALDPLNLAVNATIRPVARTAAFLAMDPDTPANIWNKAAKPTSRATFGDVDRQVQVANTALQEGLDTGFKVRLRPNRKTANYVQELRKEVGGEIGKLIRKSTEGGSMISRESLFQFWDNLKKKYASPYLLDAEKNAKIIDDMRQSYTDYMDRMMPGETLLTPKQVQKFKTRIYDLIQPKNFLEQPTEAKVAGLRSASRAAKKELEKVTAPFVEKGQKNITELNDRWGKLQDLANTLPQPTRRLGNLNFMGLGTPLRMGAGSAIGGMLFGPGGVIPGAAVGTAATIMDMPAFKFRMAENLYQMLNSPIIDPRVQRKLIGDFRNVLQELETITSKVQQEDPKEEFRPISP